MFTGIVETTGKITAIEKSGTNLSFTIASGISDQLKIDQSVLHEGICLTVDALQPGLHRVTGIEETIRKTSMGQWVVGQELNLERCLVMNGRLDGHIVQGHVDGTAVCTQVDNRNGSWNYRFEFPLAFTHLVIEKGSICLNGTSLTIFDVTDNAFTVSIIPYTYDHTTISAVRPGTIVNLEYDMIGKYIQRLVRK